MTDDLEDQGYELISAVGKSQARDVLFQNLEYVQIIVLNGFSFPDCMILMEETRNIKADAKFIVLSDEFKVDDFKGNNVIQPSAILRRSAPIESICEKIERIAEG